MTEELRPKRRAKLTEEQVEAVRTDSDFVSPLREEHDYPGPMAEPPIPDGDPVEEEIDLVAEARRIFDIKEDSIEFPDYGDREPIRNSRGRRGLHHKLAEMLAEIGSVQKTGQAPQGMGGFKFTEASHLAEKIRESLASKMISMLPETQEVAESTEFKTSRGSTQFLVTVKTTWRLTDAETGESVTFQSFGSGQDNSDKAFPKAMTNSMKYAHLMGWLVPQSDDPERFENEGKADIKIEGSNVEGLIQGGRSKNVTEPQIEAIRKRARELSLSPDQLAEIVGSVTGTKIDLGGVSDPITVVLEEIRTLTFDEAAHVVQVLLAALDPDEQAELAMMPDDIGAK